MSIVLVGSTSGSITLQEPAVAGSTTINLPATSGTALVAPTALTVPNTTGTVMVSGNMPAFSATPNGTQSISNATFTKVTLATEGFDTNSNFASSTFTPTVAGYYQLNGVAQIDSTGNFTSLSAIYKNGSSLLSASAWGGSDYPRACVSTVVYANGTTDYFDLYVRQDSGTSKNLTTATFSGCLVRAA
jgi:hypothetical protein